MRAQYKELKGWASTLRAHLPSSHPSFGMGHWVERGGASVRGASARGGGARAVSPLVPGEFPRIHSHTLSPSLSLSRSGRVSDLAANHQCRRRQQQRRPSPGADVDAGAHNARDREVAVVTPLARRCAASDELLCRAGAHCDPH